MNYSPLTIYFNVKYPQDHLCTEICGHLFRVNPQDVQPLSQLVIECVKLNGGTCSLQKEFLTVGSFPDRVAINHRKVIAVVFRKKDKNDRKYFFKLAPEIWSKINNQTFL